MNRFSLSKIAVANTILANRQFVFSVYFTPSLYMKLISGIFVQGMVYHPQGEIKHSLVSTDKT